MRREGTLQHPLPHKVPSDAYEHGHRVQGGPPDSLSEHGGHLLAVQQPELHPEHYGQPLIVVHHSFLSEIPSGISRVEAGPVPHHTSNGTPDYIIEEKDGKMCRCIRANRPKAMCFDYLQLKEMFGLDLETVAIAEDGEDDT